MKNEFNKVNSSYGSISIDQNAAGDIVISQHRTGDSGNIILTVDEMEKLAKALFGKKRCLSPSLHQSSKLPKVRFSIKDKQKEQGDNAYKPWTEEDDKKLRELHTRETSVNELADYFHRGKGAIESRLKKLGLN